MRAIYRLIPDSQKMVTKSKALNLAARTLWIILVTTAGVYLLSYVAIAFFRIQYPFELEWMEGGTVDHVRRILAGKKLYVEPSLTFIPYIYPPLYFYTSAFVSLITGVGFLPLRLVSFLASIGCFYLIYRFVRKETAQKIYGFLAAGLFAATFSISGSWFDLARVDSLFLLLLLAAVYIVRFARSHTAMVLAGTLAALAFLTKQTALLIALPIMLYMLMYNRRAFVTFSCVTAGVAGVSTFMLDVLHDGWYSYYVFELPPQHALLKRQLVDFWTKDVFLPLGIASSLAFFYFASLLSKPKNKRFVFYLLLSVGMLMGAWSSRLHAGGDNVLLPAYALISILFAIGLHSVREILRTETNAEEAVINQNLAISVAVYLACIVQFSVLIYDPRFQVPTERDAAAGERLISIVSSVEGEVLMPYHGYLPALAGKKTHAHDMAVRDVLRAGSGPIQRQLLAEIEGAIVQQKFAAIVVDHPWYQEELEQHYVHAGAIFQNDRVFWPMTGARRRPEDLYVPEPR